MDDPKLGKGKCMSGGYSKIYICQLKFVYSIRFFSFHTKYSKDIKDTPCNGYRKLAVTFNYLARLNSCFIGGIETIW